MDKEQQIEEMSGKIYVALISHDYKSNYFNRFFRGRRFDFVAEALYAADYRKQGDVVREFVEQAKERLSTLFGTDKNGFIIPTDYNGAVERCICEIIELAGEFGAEEE